MNQPLDPQIADAMALADEVPPPNDFELRQYWMRFRRGDAVTVTLIIDELARTAAIIVRSGDVDIVNVRVSPLTAFRVLDKARRVLEVRGGAGSGGAVRCLLTVDAQAVLDVKYGEGVESRVDE